MNILIISHMFPNPKNISYGIFVNFYVQTLIDLGHDVTVVAPVPYTPPLIKPKLWDKYRNIPYFRKKDNLSVYHPQFITIFSKKLLFIRGEIIYYFSFFLFKRLFRDNNFDFIHSHTVIPSGIIGNLLKLKYKIPHIVTIHGADILSEIVHSQKYYLRIIKVLSNADVVGFVSEKLKKLAIKKKLVDESKANIKVIYNGIKLPINLGEINWDDSNSDSVRILSVGNANKKKGYEYVIKSIAELRTKFNNIRYYIIGDGIDLNYFRNIAKEQNVDDITYFLGVKKNEEVLVYMKNSDIFILPSWDEGFGIVYLEAMMMRCPVIGTQNEGISEIIENGKNGYLVKPKSVEQIVTVLTKLLESPTERINVANEGYKTVINNFSWKKNANEYLNTINIL